MGGSSKSDTKTSVTTTQTDRRIGATDEAVVITEGGQLSTQTDTTITVNSADAQVISAALAGAGASISQALEFSQRQSDSARMATEQAITGLLERDQGPLRPVLLATTAIVAVVILFGARR